MRISFFVLSLFLLRFALFSQSYIQAGADTVYSYSFGNGQTFGQDSVYFPGNVLGLPDSNASGSSPSSSPTEICSLGEGGEIVLGFKNKILVDGPGADFIVFENAFYINGDTTSVFVEPGTVSVSRDGVTFIDFPIDTLTLQGCAGITPTKDPSRPFDPDLAGGDAFDLATIGMDSVRYIKIKDFVYYIKNNPNHPYYSPILSGFDLDAVTARYLVPASTSYILVRKNNLKIYYFNGYLCMENIPKNIKKVEIYSLNGKKIYDFSPSESSFRLVITTNTLFIIKIQYNNGSNFYGKILTY